MSSGKDTVGNMIKLIQPDKNWEIKKIATKIKQIASILTGFPIEKFEDRDFKNSYLPKEWDYIKDGNWIENQFVQMTVRELIQRIGTESLKRGLHPGVWINAMFSEYKSNSENNWIITDIRTIPEVKKVKELGGLTIRINKKDLLEISNHSTEMELDNYKFDYTINNNYSIEELEEKIRKILKDIDSQI